MAIVDVQNKLMIVLQENKYVNLMFTFFFYLAVFSVLVPRQTLGGLSLGLDDVITLFMLFIVMVVWLKNGFIFPAKGFAVVTFSLLLFVILFFIVGVISPPAHSVSFKLPTELWQYLKRFSFFLVGFCLFGVLFGLISNRLMYPIRLSVCVGSASSARVRC